MFFFVSILLAFDVRNFEENLNNQIKFKWKEMLLYTNPIQSGVCVCLDIYFSSIVIEHKLKIIILVFSPSIDSNKYISYFQSINSNHINENISILIYSQANLLNIFRLISNKLISIN